MLRDKPYYRDFGRHVPLWAASCTVPADGLASRPSAGTVMTKYDPMLERLKWTYFYNRFFRVKLQPWFYNLLITLCRDHPGYVLSQWETTLQRNVVSHWLNPYPEWPQQCITYPIHSKRRLTSISNPTEHNNARKSLIIPRLLWAQTALHIPKQRVYWVRPPVKQQVFWIRGQTWRL